MTVLIVDDDEGTLNTLRAGLISYGYEVSTAADGCQALGVVGLSLAQSKPIELMVTDLKMPLINGLKLMKLVKLLIPDLIVILMTAYGNDEVRNEVMKMDLCEYIEKPFTPEALLEIIKTAKSLSNGMERPH